MKYRYLIIVGVLFGATGQAEPVARDSQDSQRRVESLDWRRGTVEADKQEAVAAAFAKKGVSRREAEPLPPLVEIIRPDGTREIRHAAPADDARRESPK